MFTVNTYSLIDVVAIAILSHVLVGFVFRYWRISRRPSDLLFAVMLTMGLAISVLIFYVDNIVPVGVPAISIPDARERTLELYRLLFASGMLMLASILHFSLRYCESSRLLGWQAAFLYGFVFAVIGICWNDKFCHPPVEPREVTSSWLCAVPWQPEAGPLLGIFIALWFGVNVYVQWLFHKRARSDVDTERLELTGGVVRAGVTAAGLSWAVEPVMFCFGYAGVDPGLIVTSIAMLAIAIGLAEEHARSEKEREHVTRRFRSYVDPALVKYVLEHPESERIGSEVRELTVVFTDLEGFTTISERLREGVVELVNEYLKVMTPLIRNHNGYRDKFLGDGMKFFYGAPERNPDHAIHAVSTVLKMEETMRELNLELATKKRHLLEGFPKLVMRAGVSTGVMVVGDAGTNEASDYTVLGDTVNLGARLETANKATGTHILLSDRTVELIPAELFLVRPIARLRVVGRMRPVMTYEPLAFTKEATPEQVRCAELTRPMVDSFLRGDFAGCAAAERILEAAMGPSKLGALYRDLCAKYIADPPGVSFTGEIVLAEK